MFGTEFKPAFDLTAHYRSAHNQPAHLKRLHIKHVAATRLALIDQIVRGVVEGTLRVTSGAFRISPHHYLSRLLLERPDALGGTGSVVRNTSGKTGTSFSLKASYTAANRPGPRRSIPGRHGTALATGGSG